MTKAQQTLSLGLLVASFYLLCLLGLVPFPTKIQDEVIPVLPFWAIVSFGSYLLFKLGWGVLFFNNVPEAHKELMLQIDQARKDLTAKGVEVD